MSFKCAMECKFFLLILSVIAAAQSEDAPCPPDGISFNCTDQANYTLCISGAMYNLQCRSPNPYCVKGSGTVRDGCKSQKPEAFQCPSTPGFYPDLTSCQTFYMCSSSGQYVSFDCGKMNGGTFNGNKYGIQGTPLINTCQNWGLPAGANKCQTFNCTGKNLQGAPYVYDDSIYAQCLNGKPAKVMTCPEGKSFNQTLNACSYMCARPGIIPSEDPKGFQICYFTSSWKLGTLQGSCPSNHLFDKITSLCVPPQVSSKKAVV